MGSDPVVSERPKNMTYESGGADLWSTIDDYLKFARLFLGDGAVDGVRLLRPATLSTIPRNPGAIRRFGRADQQFSPKTWINTGAGSRPN
jgi:CubicO group peptidase (beta-lactamase class C family)